MGAAGLESIARSCVERFIVNCLETRLWNHEAVALGHFLISSQYQSAHFEVRQRVRWE